MGSSKNIPQASAGSPTPASAKDLASVCQALQELKRQLQDITGVTSGGNTGHGVLLAAVDACPDGVLVTSNEAQIVMVNGAAARLTGLSTRELQSITLWDITHPSSQVDFEVLWKEFRRAGRQRGIYSIRHRDGSAVVVAYCAEVDVLPLRLVLVLRKLSQ
jgi:PAS domain S-box-containing protein